MTVTGKYPRLFTEFFESEKTGGVLLIGCTIISLLVANSAFQLDYLSFWKTPVAGYSVTHWINDGLMAVFFLLIGLELEREIYTGELSDIKNASLPVFAAIGGMVVPALFFILVNFDSPARSGAGIPMATDIAFAIGILSLLGNRVPASLKVLLTALAVADDLGAILIIAIFYTGTVVLANLLISLGIFTVLILLNRLKVHNLIPYVAGGIAMWYFMHHSGVHATITGVLLAFALPFGNGGEKSPSYLLQHWLHKPVAFIILPVFALANTSIPISSDWYSGLMQPLSLGIMAGLVLGKPLGILFFSYSAVSLRLCTLPPELNWKHITGIGLLAGIGFTMSIFITILAFSSAEMINAAKIAILVASFVAGLSGYIWLSVTLGKRFTRKRGRVIPTG